ncbi:MAG: hypothetical protein PHU80_05180 [Kiritimatiellae bacterium]|nr:hypothetical protein [Kiritimatiellia bacterium]
MESFAAFLNSHPPNMETLGGVHHFYGGMGLTLLGYLIVACGRRRLVTFGLVAVIAGALIMADDIWQHSVQYVRNENYASPCKRLYWFVSPRCPFIRETVALSDRLFRRLDHKGNQSLESAPPEKQ